MSNIYVFAKPCLYTQVLLGSFRQSSNTGWALSRCFFPKKDCQRLSPRSAKFTARHCCMDAELCILEPDPQRWRTRSRKVCVKEARLFFIGTWNDQSYWGFHTWNGGHGGTPTSCVFFHGIFSFWTIHKWGTPIYGNPHRSCNIHQYPSWAAFGVWLVGWTRPGLAATFTVTHPSLNMGSWDCFKKTAWLDIYTAMTCLTHWQSYSIQWPGVVGEPLQLSPLRPMSPYTYHIIRCLI